jgi:hypothetical protein
MEYTYADYMAAAERAKRAGDTAAEARLRAKAEALVAQYQEPPKERVRTLAQGATLGSADEIEAGIRSMAGEPYDQAVGDIRKKLSDYKQAYPYSSTGYEMIGAAGAGLAAAPFTGGASVPSTLGRAAFVGGVEGGIYGFNTGEGNFMERLPGAAKGAGVGVVAGPVGYGVSKAVTGPAVKLIDMARRKLGGKASTAVQAELQRLASDAGLSVDEVADRISRGELMAEMSETLMQSARALKVQPGPQAEVISRTFKNQRPDGSMYTRAGDKRNQAMQQLQQGLTDGIDGNVFKAVKQSEADFKRAENAAYDRVFSGAPQVSDDVTNETLNALSRSPDVAAEVASNLRLATGRTPFFQIKDGKFTLNRPPSLQEIELTRRTLQNAKDNAYKNALGTRGELLGDIEGGVRRAVDDFSPELRGVREQAANFRNARDAFEAGRMALTKSADEVEVEFEKVSRLGADAVSAYRTGVMHSLRRNAETGQGASLMGRISDESRREGSILRMILPADQLDSVMGSVNQAAQSQRAQNVIMGGSQTAETTARIGGQGAAGLVVDATQALRGSPAAALRVASRVAESAMSRLNDKQKLEVAKLLVQQNPDALRRALKDEGGLRALQNVVEGLATAVTVGATSAAPVGAIDQTRGLLSGEY